jgi:hypothetical protein
MEYMEMGSSGKLTAKEFYAWRETQVDAYELIRGVPVRKPDCKQGGRRMGDLYRAADLALGDQASAWLDTSLPEFGNRLPYEVAAESWSSLAALLTYLADPEDGRMRFGDRLRDIKDRASRLAAIESRHAF